MASAISTSPIPAGRRQVAPLANGDRLTRAEFERRYAAIDWFSLEAGEYVPIPPQADGTLCSRIFPGLCVHPSSLLGADLPALFALLDSTTAVPEHASFVTKLGRTEPPPADQ